MSLFDDLGLDPENFSWEDLATCAGMETIWFYDEYESDEIHARNIDSICARCPAQQACGVSGMQNKEEGVWGGLYLSNGKVDKTKNRHKTAEEWKCLSQTFNLSLP